MLLTALVADRGAARCTAARDVAIALAGIRTTGISLALGAALVTQSHGASGGSRADHVASSSTAHFAGGVAVALEGDVPRAFELAGAAARTTARAGLVVA